MHDLCWRGGGGGTARTALQGCTPLVAGHGVVCCHKQNIKPNATDLARHVQVFRINGDVLLAAWGGQLASDELHAVEKDGGISFVVQACGGYSAAVHLAEEGAWLKVRVRVSNTAPGGGSGGTPIRVVAAGHFVAFTPRTILPPPARAVVCMLVCCVCVSVLLLFPVVCIRVDAK